MVRNVMEGIELLQDTTGKLEQVVAIQIQFIREVVDENEDLIAGLVTSQMDRGEDATGKITPEYSPGYAAFKGFTTPNLRLEGDFHRSVFAEALADGIEIDATDPKTERLVGKYGENILSLQDSSIDEFNEGILLSELQIKNERFLGI